MTDKNYDEWSSSINKKLKDKSNKRSPRDKIKSGMKDQNRIF